MRDRQPNAATAALAVVLAFASSVARAGDVPCIPSGEMQSPRQMHGAAVLGDYLYVVGGELGALGQEWRFTSSVQVGRIGEDGYTSNWRPTTPLPEVRTYIGNSTVTASERMYVVGGSVPERGLSATVLWTDAQADGMLAPWRESAPFPGGGRSFSCVVTTPGKLHVIGGMSEEDSTLATVASGTFAEDGSISSWESAPNLPAPLGFHSAAAVGGRVYVWGGLEAKHPKPVVSSRVFWAPIAADGRLGDWREDAAVLDKPFYHAATASAGKYMMSFGGRTPNGDLRREVWFATVDQSGNLRPGGSLPTALPVSLYIAAAADYRRGRLYVPGGRNRLGEDQGAVESVVYGFPLRGSVIDHLEGSVVVAKKTGDGIAVDVPSAPKSEPLTGFRPYSEALKFSLSLRQPLVLYFHSEESADCVRQREALEKTALGETAFKASFAWLDASEWTQMAKELGVFRTPTWIVYDGDGIEAARFDHVIEPTELEPYLKPARVTSR